MWAWCPILPGLLVPEAKQRGWKECRIILTSMKLSAQEDTVPGLDSSATNTIMAGSSSPLSAPTAELNILEINKKLCLQLEEKKQQFRDLKEKFLLSEATVYSLANQLWKYKCGDYKVIESVLGEKLQPEEGELTETLMLTEKLRESNILIEDQAQKLSRLEQKLQEGRDVSFLLSQHLKDLLTQDDSGDSQALGLQEQLAEGCWLAECLVLKLSPGNNEDDGNDNDCKWLFPRLSREGQEERVKETLGNSLDEGLKTPSSYHDLSYTHHPPSITGVLLDDHEESSLDAAGTQDDRMQEEEEEAVIFRRELQDIEDITAVQNYSLDEMYLTASSFHDLCDFQQSLNTALSPPEKQFVCSNLATVGNEIGYKAGEGQEVKAVGELQENGSLMAVPQDSFCCHNQSEFYEPTKSPPSVSEEHMAQTALDGSGKKMGCKGREGQEEKAPRKYCVLLHDQGRELTQLHQQLQEGRVASLSLSQHLKDLLTQKDPDFYEGQGYREQLDEGRRLVEHLVCKLSTENHENEEEEKEKETLSKINDQNREFNFLIQVQARELALLRQKLQEGREASLFLSQHVNNLFTQDDIASHHGQGHREQLAEGCRLAEHLAHRLCPENIEDEDDDNEEQVLPELDPRKDDVLVQVQGGEVTQLLQQLQEKREASFSLSHQLEDLHTQENPDNHEDHGDQPAEACRVVEPFVYKMSAENHNDDDDDDDDEDSLNSRLNSQLQEEKVKEVFTYLSGEEYFHPCTHPDQLDSQECLRVTALLLDGPKVSPALNQNQSDLDASIEVKNPEMLECNTAEGLVNNMHEFQHGFLGAPNVLKQEIIKRILLFSKWRNECRFPGSTCRGWFCPTNDVTSASSYLEFPWAAAVSIPASSSPMRILSSDPKQPCSSNTLTAIDTKCCWN